VRYLTLAEALLIAEAVTGIDARALSFASRVDLLDSALHAPQAGFGDEDSTLRCFEKAAVLVVRIAGNHPLPDGNKRLAWQALTIFLALNGHRLAVGAMSFARRSSLFSRSSCTICCASTIDVPGRFPESTSARFSH